MNAVNESTSLSRGAMSNQMSPPSFEDFLEMFDEIPVEDVNGSAEWNALILQAIQEDGEKDE